MKSLTIALVGTIASASAFAQVSPDSASNTGKTRAQVYQEPVHAEQDGQPNDLNSTLYSH